MKNPEYFFDILPYTYVLNISDKWIKKFEKIAIKSPFWFKSYNKFSLYTFNIFIENSFIAPTSYSHSTRRRYSGGGSGGGYGGAGGGSW